MVAPGTNVGVGPGATEPATEPAAGPMRSPTNVVTSADAELQTLEWVKRVVIGLGLCPWAAGSLTSGALRIRAAPTDSLEELAVLVEAEAAALAALPSLAEDPRGGTALIVAPGCRELDDFESYLDFVEELNAMIEDNGWSDLLQVTKDHRAVHMFVLQQPSGHATPLAHACLEQP